MMIERFDGDSEGVDTRLARSLWKIWSKSRLGDPWIVGNMKAIFLQHKPTSKFDFEEKYLSLGQDRRSKIQSISKAEKFNYVPSKSVVELLDSLQNRYKRMKELGLQNLAKLNYEYGRTNEDLMRIARFFYEKCKKAGRVISIDQAFGVIRWQTICHTWNGFVSEHKAIQILQDETLFDYRPTDENSDSKMAVDYRVYAGEDFPIAGVQIKDITSIAGNIFGKPWQNRINVEKREAEFQKNRAFCEKFNVPVIWVYYDDKTGIMDSGFIVSVGKSGLEVFELENSPIHYFNSLANHF